eukprot:scaffold107933_cov63-Phaeocystis_antarctica.AAC.4
MWAPIQVAESEWLLFPRGPRWDAGQYSEACDREDGTTDREDCAQVLDPRDTRAKKSELVYPPRWIERELTSRTWRVSLRPVFTAAGGNRGYKRPPLYRRGSIKMNQMHPELHH